MFYFYISLKITLDQGWAALALKIHFPTEFCCNLDQTHLNKLISVFRNYRKLQAWISLIRAGAKLSSWILRARVAQPCFRYYFCLRMKSWNVFVYFTVTGRAATSPAFVEYSQNSSLQKCCGSQWPSSHDVSPATTFWSKRLPEASLSGGCRSLPRGMPSERAILMWWDSFYSILSSHGREPSSSTHNTWWSDWIVPISEELYNLKYVNMYDTVAHLQYHFIFLICVCCT